MDTTRPTVKTIPADRMFILNMHISDFLEIVEESGKSKLTIDAYRFDLFGFSRWLRKRNISFFPSSRSDMEEYILSLTERGLKPITISRHMSSLRIFFNYLVDESIFTTNPMDDIPLPKVQSERPQSLTEKEVRLMLRVPNVIDPIGYRNRVMLELLFSTGIKTSELISIKMSQMKLDEHVLQIAKEGLPEQLLPLDDRVCALLNSFIKVQRLEILLERGSDYLFPTRRGDRMTRQAFWYLFGKCSKAAGINKKVTPSAARHTFAIRLLEEGKSQEAVSKLLLLSDASAVRKIYGYVEKISKPKAGSLLALDT